MMISEIAKNTKERIKVTIQDYHGHRFVDCRVYFADDTGTWRPTKKGIALNSECIEDVIKALGEASGVLQREATSEQR